MGKYFGTDGFRGEANVTLTADHAFRIGKFLGYYFKMKNKNCRIVIGKDTRRSSYMFEYAIAAGITSTGADAYLLHVTSTPSVSYVVRTEQFDLGVMISASHNPYYDNGIKLINSNGEKLEENVTDMIEDYLDGKIKEIPYAAKTDIGRTVDYFAGRNRYIGYLNSITTKCTIFAQLDTIPSYDYPIQIQEFIKKESEVMLLGCSINHGNDIVSNVALQKLRYYPDVYSAGSYGFSLEVEKSPDLLELRRKVNQYLREIGYNGLFSAEFLKQQDKYYFLEVNLRNDGLSYVSTACGFNLPDIYVRMMSNEKFPHSRYSHKTFMTDYDYRHVIKGEVSFSQWIKEAFPSVRCYYSRKDIMPFIYYKYIILGRKFTHMIHTFIK